MSELERKTDSAGFRTRTYYRSGCRNIHVQVEDPQILLELLAPDFEGSSWKASVMR